MTKSNRLKNRGTKSLNDLCKDELTVIGSYLSTWNDLWSLRFTSTELKGRLIHQQNDKLWEFFFKEYFPYIPLPTKDFYKNFIETYKIWYQTLCRVKQDPFFLMYLGKFKEDPAQVFKNDKEIVIAAIEKQPLLYKNFSGRYKEDEEVILCALKQNRFIIHDVPRTMRQGFKEIADIKEDKARSDACDKLIDKLSSQRVSKIKSLNLFKSHLKLQPRDITKRGGETANNHNLQNSTVSITTAGVPPRVNLGMFKNIQTHGDHNDESIHSKYRK